MYNQSQKKTARKTALKHAVDILTTKRKSGTVVKRGYVKKVRDDLLRRAEYDKAVASECSNESIQDWENFWLSKVGTKTPSDLIVAYLAGPEPMNDFLELVNLGVLPYNIYAFESDNKAFNQALENVKKSKNPLIKIIKMPMDRYLQSVPIVFDIIYFDACGPFPSSAQATLRTVANIFRYQRLNQLSVLITNFAKPDIKDIHQFNAYADLITAYLYPKAMLESGAPEWNLTDGALVHGKVPKDILPDKSFFNDVKDDFSNYYGQYITRQLFDLASFIAPVVRLHSTNLWEYFFSSVKDLKDAAVQQKSFDEDCSGGDYIVDPDINSLGWTLASLEKHMDSNYLIPETTPCKLIETWRRELGGMPNIQIDDIIDAYFLIRNSMIESYIKPPMWQLLNGYNYMQEMYMFCDVPSYELSLFPILAQYAMPYHYNIDETRRYTYIADGKSTEMFLDVIPFDTCRYIYDWLPSTELVEESFNIVSHQLVYRFALDWTGYSLVDSKFCMI